MCYQVVKNSGEMMNTSEDHEALMARAIIEAEKALSLGEFPVGCVMTAVGKVIVGGRRKNSQKENRNELDHAEIVTLRELSALTKRPDFSEITVYSTMEPCLMCFSTLLLSGIRKFVYGYEDVMGGGCSLDLSGLAPLYRDMQPEIIPGIRRAECLALFQSFFNDPAHHYWRGSELAQYTLEQK